MSLAAGRLRHRVTIEQKVTTRDPDTGAPITAWQTWAANVAAEVAPLSVKEFLAAQQLQSEVSARITIRYRSGVLATMRIRFKGQIYNIAGALPDAVSGLEYLTLPVSQGTNDG